MGETGVEKSPRAPLSGKKRKVDNSLQSLQAMMHSWTGNPVLLEKLEAYREMRERIRKPLTREGFRLAFEKLERLADTDEQKIAILEQSIFNSWQGLFELRPDTNRASPGMSWQEREEDAFSRALEEARKRDEARAKGEAV